MIEAAFPPADRESLTDALELARNAEKTRHQARDEEEAGAIMAAARQDGYLHSMDVRRKGLLISCRYDVEFLAKLFLRHRHGDIWDFSAFFARQTEAYLERVAQERRMRREGARMARESMAKRIGSPIFRGRSGAFWRSDLAAFGALQPDLRTPFEAAMRKLGFTLLGEITPKRLRDYALLCHLSPDRTSYAALTASRYGYLCFEFISEFTDGSRLTTTTSALAFSRPDVGLYYKDFQGMDAEALHAKHLELRARFIQHKQVQPIELEDSLEELARRLDDTIIRTEEDECNHPDDDDDYDDDDD